MAVELGNCNRSVERVLSSEITIHYIQYDTTMKLLLVRFLLLGSDQILSDIVNALLMVRMTPHTHEDPSLFLFPLLRIPILAPVVGHHSLRCDKRVLASERESGQMNLFSHPGGSHPFLPISSSIETKGDLSLGDKWTPSNEHVNRRPNRALFFRT